MSSLFGWRVLARAIDFLFASVCFQTLSWWSEPPFTALSAVFLYGLCSVSFGRSLGKVLCGISLRPEAPWRLVVREVLLWGLAPLVLLSLLGGAPLHDRITQCEVRFDRL